MRHPCAQPFDRLRTGYMRLRCEGCARELLGAFSCKPRGICPSCCRRMAQTAAYLVDSVIPRVPVRQWVLWYPDTAAQLVCRASRTAGAGAANHPSHHQYVPHQTSLGPSRRAKRTTPNVILSSRSRRSWRRNSMQHAVDTDVRINVRPVHAYTVADQFPMFALGGGCVRQSPRPGERNAHATPVNQKRRYL